MSPYQKLYSLSQNYRISLNKVTQMRKSAFGGKNLRNKATLLSVDKIKRVIEDLEIKNLPMNHSLIEREKIYMESTYNLNEYLEVPICVVILSHNNIKNERYKKVLYSLYLQNYTNYRTLFIDDASTDGNLRIIKIYGV